MTGTLAHACRRPRALSYLVAFVAAFGLIAALAPAASAQVTPPPPVVNIGGATGSTISNVKLNGVTTTVATVAPGSTVAVGATLTLGPGVNPGWFYNAPIAFAGQPYPSGLSCLGGGGVGYTQTGTFNLTAPTTAGVYPVAAELGPNFICADSWNPSSAQPVIAQVVVTSYSSVCALAESYSTDPWVAAGLCDKLYAAEMAAGRGQDKVKANILRAFDNQVDAQTGKALTMEQAAELKLLASYL